MTIAIKTLLRLRRPCTATGMGFVANLRKRRIALAGCRDQAAIANNDAIMMRCANLARMNKEAERRAGVQSGQPLSHGHRQMP